MKSELDILEDYLMEHSIPYERIDYDDVYDGKNIVICARHQICVPSERHKKWDAICNRGSYGYEQGLLEIYGSIVRQDAEDSVEGWLTAEDVIERIDINGKV